ncbi:MAG: NADP-dependent malic enzyme [Candidatus Gracilibacteria bacterium]
MSIYDQSLQFHAAQRGKLSVRSKSPISNYEELSLAYTPGVAAPCREIARDPDLIYKYTMKGNAIAVITDGSAVLGLGNIGAKASLPVMEGKCVLFQQFAGIDAFPLCIESKDMDDFVETVKKIVAPFGGVNLEDIGAPHCFEIERRLKEALDIPVFHDDQHGTAIVVLGALINAFKVTGRSFGNVKIVISGAGAAGTAIAKLLIHYGAKNVIVCDSKGAIAESRDDLAPYKKDLLAVSNPDNVSGSLAEALKGADVFIGVSAPGIVTQEMVKSMGEDPIVFALANPTPEIMPDEASAAGAVIIGTGRSDFPNQINNVLAFPGLFRGVLDARIRNISEKMYTTAAEALAAIVEKPTKDMIIPHIFDETVVPAIASAVKSCA